MYYRKHRDMTVSEYTIIQLENAQHSLNTIHTLINSIYNDPSKLRQDVVNHRLDTIRDVVKGIDLSLTQVRQLNTVVSVVHTEMLDNNIVLEIHRYGLPISYK